MSTELKSSAIEPDNASPQSQVAQGPANRGFDAEMTRINDALSRIVAQARADQAALAMLRESLSTMVRIIGQAKSAYAVAGDSVDTLIFLDELEHLVDRMTQTAGAGEPEGSGAGPDPDAAATAPGVPTVSAVVSQLSAAEQETPSAALDATREAAVSDLKAMLEAMNAAAAAANVADEVDTGRPAAADAWATPGTSAEPDPLPLAEPDFEPAAPQRDAAARVDVPDLAGGPATATDPTADLRLQGVPDPAFPDAATADDRGIAPDNAPANVEPLNPLPLPSLEDARAVMFEPPAEPASAAVLPGPPEIDELPSAALPPEPRPADSVALEPPAGPPAEALSLDRGGSPPPSEATSRPDPDASLPAEGGAGGPAAALPAAPVPAVAPPEPEFDPDDFLFGAEPQPDPALFGPEPEPDPAAFLLDGTQPESHRPAPPPQPEGSSHDASVADATAAAAEAGPAEAPRSAVPAYDPLHAIKSMSEEERLALFS